MITSEKGIRLIKQFEGCRLTAYLTPELVAIRGPSDTAGLTL